MVLLNPEFRNADFITDVDDFHSVRDLDYLRRNDYAHANFERLDFWNLNIPLSPQDFYNIMTAGLPARTQVVLSYFAGVSLTTNTTISVSAANSSDFDDSRQIDFKRGIISTGNIEVDEACQGQGIGRRLIANYIELGKALGLNFFEAKAGNLNGAYTWAKFGIYLDMDDKLSANRAGLSATCLDRLDNLEGLIPAALLVKAKSFICLSDPEDITKIADLDFDLFSVEQIWDEGDNSNPLKALFKNCVEEEQEKEQCRVRAAAKYCRDKKIPFTLGRYLLAGQSWDGIIDFKNVAQMERVEKYIGGWKFPSTRMSLQRKAA